MQGSRVGHRCPKPELLHVLLDSLASQAAANGKGGAHRAHHNGKLQNGTAGHPASNSHAELTNGHSHADANGSHSSGKCMVIALACTAAPKCSSPPYLRSAKFSDAQELDHLCLRRLRG